MLRPTLQSRPHFPGSRLFCAVFALVTLAWIGSASAQIISDSPELPPDPESDCEQVRSQYVGTDILGLFPGGIDLSQPRYHCFRNVLQTPLPQGELQQFDATLEVVVNFGAGNHLVTLEGPAQTLAYGRNPGDSEGSWQTEILSMDLSGSTSGIAVDLRQSPIQPSVGQTSIAGLGGGLYEINSFFDVFIELSIDGGPFQPSLGPPGRLTLERVSKGGATLPSSELPPEPDPVNCDRLQSRYADDDTLVIFPNGIELTMPIHRCFVNVVRNTAPATGDETQSFDSIFEGFFDDGSGPAPVTLIGPVTTVARGKAGATTGSWDTEILSMSLSGDVGGVSIDIRESPGLPSPGETKVAGNGDGSFQIDSFFDVFVELSIDGGPFQPQTSGAGRMELERIRPTVTLPSPGLPPESDPPNCDRVGSEYVGFDGRLFFSNGIELTMPIHRCFVNVVRNTDPATGDETQSFDSIFEGFFDDGSGPAPVTLMGPVTTVARGKGGATTGSWDTEILSMSLSGDVGGVSIDIRESPGLPSPGETSVTDNGDGSFQIDSFFDVFTELSIDGGPFQPQSNSAGRMELQPIRPSVRLHSPALPPERDPPHCDRIASRYVGGDPFVIFPNGIGLFDPLFSCFKNTQTTTDPTTGDETKTFDSIFEGIFDDGSGPSPFTLMGPVTTVARDKGGATTGSWDTEILSMSLSGDVGGVSIEIRESPNLASPGETEVADNGDGSFQIDSFFDVFTEISVDGGPFQPQTNGAGRMDLEPIRPSVDLPSPGLPPESDPPFCWAAVSMFADLEGQILYPSGIDFYSLRHECFQNTSTSVEPASGDETSTFDSKLTAIIDDGSGPQLATLTGSVTTVARGKGGATTGSWDTEILSMSLSGDVGGVSIEIRESPGLPSPGRAVVADNGDGTFNIDSFFDVFTELSIDGGPFQPQTNSAARLDLQPAIPQVILGDPSLPPESNPPDCSQLLSAYFGLGPAPLFPSGIALTDLIYRCFENVSVSVDPSTQDETATFDAILDATLDLGGGPQTISLTGPVMAVTRKAQSTSQTGTFQTEILSMSLSGSAGGSSIDIRESPSLPSPGQSRISDVGNGDFQIDSFFDVFVELSIDGGPFQPQTSQATRLELIYLPEPGQLLMLLSGMSYLHCLARRRRYASVHESRTRFARSRRSWPVRWRSVPKVGRTKTCTITHA